MERKSNDPSSKRIFIVTPNRRNKIPIVDDIEPLQVSAPTRNETMGLCLSLAQIQERYILFEEEPRVLIIYSSGSFGCLRVDAGGYETVPGSLEAKIRSYTTLCDQDYTKLHAGAEQWIYTPRSVFKKRVRYRIRELSNIMPSCNTSLAVITEIAQVIQKAYCEYEAFVILHGTDIIGYTAPILSFMLENLRKTVIITACLIPLSVPRNDASNNLVTALTIAGHYYVPEVCVLFGNALYRGNRIIKEGTSSLNLIKSPNFAPLATVESYFNVAWDKILYTNSKKPFSTSLNFETSLTSISIFPFMPLATFSSVFVEGVKGKVRENVRRGDRDLRLGQLSLEQAGSAGSDKQGNSTRSDYGERDPVH
eukprot:TRINITY_DN7186_c0_g2_i2.p1 TRINITY_DN7186_c0_g2~~TRINITY_DN7186_c0_g2_i2.p1  ORF type:complete len:366 (+),score=66.33 TRINITY_DN7186_c0_g2_i2:52-1149(+)